MPRKLQILVEVDLESGSVNVTAPWNQVGAVVKALGAALGMAGDAVATQQKESDEALKRALEGRTETGIIVPKGVARA